VRPSHLALTLLGLCSCATVKGGAARFEIDRGHLFVQATIGGQGPFWLMLDTGSEQTIVSAEVAARLHLEARRRARIVAIGGTRVGTLDVVSDLEVGGASIGGLEVLIGASNGGSRADGVLGGSFLREFRTTIDYLAQVVTFVPP
jgi:predicted aspartyl protease